MRSPGALLPLGFGGLGIVTAIGGASLRFNMFNSVLRDSSSVAWNLIYAAMRFCSSISLKLSVLEE